MYQIKSLILLLTSAAIISSCGFKPLYAKKNPSGKVCDNFSVTSENYQEVGHKVKYSVQDSLNLACVDVDNMYRIELVLDKEKQEVGIQKDREVTRYNLIFLAKYKIFKNAEEKPFDEGYNKLVGGYDAVVSDYGTFSNEQDTFENLADEMANELSLKFTSIVKRQEDK